MASLISLISLLIAGLLARLGAAQQAGWVTGQVNTTMCQWPGPRAAVIRDTVYIDGGYLWWEPGMSDGTYGPLIMDGNPLGIVYLLNFSTPFNTTPSFNLTSVFATKSKGAGGSEANNIGPLYYDGAMLANDYEWFTYGGLLEITDAYPPPPDNAVAEYQAYAYGPPKQFGEGYVLEYLPSGMTRYVTDGAAVSVPSENLGFYFGGLRSSTFGEIYYDPGEANLTLNADDLSETLIELDMRIQTKPVWNNYTLPSYVPGRANAEVVWIPVSKQGLLVAIGGVIFPAYANVNQTDNAAQTAQSQEQSPKFMSTVAVYDIAAGVWYEQDTWGGGPGQTTLGCAVVASAEDGSSHNIYWYGGFDGLHQAGAYSDDVWVLSVPSFMWMKVKSGTPSHGRAGHKCVKPYPDQMFVIGGYPSLAGESLSCLEGGVIQIFNLNTLDWVETYDPNVWSNYSVPEMIYNMIGGTGTGSATMTAPSPSVSSNATLNDLFLEPYNISKITTWYPYQASGTSPSRIPTLLPSAVPKPGTPSFLAPVLGVILGLVFITCLVVAVMLYRRRKLLSVNGTATRSDNGTVDPQRSMLDWLRRIPPDAKAPTVTTDDTPSSPYDEDNPYIPPAAAEIGGGQVYEMMDTSGPQELHDTGFIPVSFPASRSTPTGGLTSSPSVASHTSATSTISHLSGRHPSNPAISPIARSPNVPDAPSPKSPEEGRVISGISNLSETDRGHLRGISETSGVSVEHPVPAGPAISPVSPPMAAEGRDYVNARPGGEGTFGEVGGSGSPGTNRRSNFSEELDR